MYDIDELIDGDKFENLADLHFSTLSNNIFKFNYGLNYEIMNFDCTPIVYCDTDKIRDFFNYINISKDIKLLSHNGDSQIRDDEIIKPEYIKLWYANNYIGNKSDIISIPCFL